MYYLRILLTICATITTCETVIIRSLREKGNSSKNNSPKTDLNIKHVFPMPGMYYGHMQINCIAQLVFISLPIIAN